MLHVQHNNFLVFPERVVMFEGASSVNDAIRENLV